MLVSPLLRWRRLRARLRYEARHGRNPFRPLRALPSGRALGEGRLGRVRSVRRLPRPAGVSSRLLTVPVPRSSSWRWPSLPPKPVVVRRPRTTSRGVPAAPQGCEDTHGTVLPGRWDPNRPRCYSLRLGVTFRDRTALPHGAVASGPPSTGVCQARQRAPRPTCSSRAAPRRGHLPSALRGGAEQVPPAPQTASSSRSL